MEQRHLKVMSIFTVKQWGATEERFKTAAEAIVRAVQLIEPSNKSNTGLGIYLHRQLRSHFAVEYQDVVIRHLIPGMGDGTKHIPTYTDVTSDLPALGRGNKLPTTPGHTGIQQA